MGRDMRGPLGLPEWHDFLGKIQVISEEEQANMGKDAVYVMMRVVDDDPSLAWPELLRRRVKTLCDDCREPCWLDPKAFGRTPAHVPRICIPCLGRREGNAQ